MRSVVIIGLLALLVLIAGCTSSTDKAMMEKKAMLEKKAIEDKVTQVFVHDTDNYLVIKKALKREPKAPSVKPPSGKPKQEKKAKPSVKPQSAKK